MSSSIHLLSAKLLEQDQKLIEIDHWLKVMNRGQGWHYDMDITWILNELERSGIKRGATILDAGAGMGVTQFILASRGYNVISLDFSQRGFPELARGIFNIEFCSQEALDYKHDYMGTVDYGTKLHKDSARKQSSLSRFISNVFRIGPSYISQLITGYSNNSKNLRANTLEKKNDHSNFGKIKFIRAAFHSIPLEDCSVDALVSVSAIEHADQKIMDKNFSELKRVVKKGGPLLITTSATDNEKDVYHEKTLGWCYSLESLKRFTGISDNVEFNYIDTKKAILESDLWRSRIDPYYSLDKNSGFYKGKVNHLPYLAVGLKIIR